MNAGTVVMSLAGHDKGKLYAVIGKEGEKILLCDGKCKKLSDPKKKNIRHLKDAKMYIDFSKYNPLYDAHIRKELKSLDKLIGSIICSK